MAHSNLKVLFCLAVGLVMLLAPLALDIFPDGKAYAFSSRSRNNGHFEQSDNSGSSTNHWWSKNEFPKGEGPHQVPEPATMLLLGVGLAGVAFLRKKSKK
jgi:hypothetical protein